jgi:hypothetical protein
VNKGYPPAPHLTSTLGSPDRALVSLRAGRALRSEKIDETGSFGWHKEFEIAARVTAAVFMTICPMKGPVRFTPTALTDKEGDTSAVSGCCLELFNPATIRDIK